jgi:CsoR family transcriptional regulator, copper-sensing transcriptional repressor
METENIMTTSYTHNKDALLKRLTRAEGQVRGVSRLVAEDTYCIDVLTQISAVQAALDKIAVELLRDHAKHCMSHEESPEQQTQKADELVRAINRMLSR